MSIESSTARWGALARAFHWVGAILVLTLVIHGWWMTEYPAREMRFIHYGWHGSIGYLALALTLLRLLWRWMHAIPPMPANSLAWERAAARLSHWGMYFFIVGASVSGWALAGTFKRPLTSTLLGFPLPPLVTAKDRALHEQLEGLHSVLSWVLAAIVAVHVVAAFYHLWIRRDDIMQRMLPWGSRAD